MVSHIESEASQVQEPEDFWAIRKWLNGEGADVAEIGHRHFLYFGLNQWACRVERMVGKSSTEYRCVLWPVKLPDFQTKSIEQTGTFVEISHFLEENALKDPVENEL